MPRTRSPKRSPVYVDQPPAEPTGVASGAAPATSDVPYRPEPPREAVGQRVEAMRLDELWLESQPREIVPEEALQGLIAAGRAQPAALLATLRAAADQDPYYREVLASIEGLASSIRSQGVLQPIEVVIRPDGRYVVRDGHRRSLASLLAERATVPGIVVDEPTELEAVARPLIVNLQRQDLTPIEKGAALLRLALLVAKRLTDQAGAAGGGPLDLVALLGSADGGDADASAGAAAENGSKSTITGAARKVAVEVRDAVCAMVGLPPKAYYRLLALNRLAPTARALGRGLTESHLRPITALPAEAQAEVTAFAIRRQLTSKEIGTLAQVARSGDRDAVAKVMARLAKEEQTRQRTAVSWEALLSAVPRDVERRCLALEAELAALDPDRLRVRLSAIAEQMPLLLTLHRRFEMILATYTSVPVDDEGEAPARR
ncbi:MAG: ParB/RepB/Spo0J family partition protein [Chloroflexi bacterium]|nr:ParB/RepB/Spo0J family partition protein [Chloroflexota bacterium]